MWKAETIKINLSTKEETIDFINLENNVKVTVIRKNNSIVKFEKKENGAIAFNINTGQEIKNIALSTYDLLNKAQKMFEVYDNYSIIKKM